MDNINCFLNYNWLRENATHIHAFGLGFIQIKLNNINRIHFWLPLVDKTTHDEEIHNHRYNFKSTILRGKITNHLYGYDRCPFAPYGRYEVSCDPNIPIDDPLIDEGYPRYLGSFDSSDGDSYIFTKNLYHRITTDFAITAIERDIDGGIDETAVVIKKTDTPMVCPFSANKPIDTLWKTVKDILDETA
ncbi:MAG: hypothetical protein WC284_04385 [Candidimonas sp.]